MGNSFSMMVISGASDRALPDIPQTNAVFRSQRRYFIHMRTPTHIDICSAACS